MRSEVRPIRFISLLLLLVVSSIAGAQDFHYVPDDFATISEAIAAAAGGDFVVVRDGVYSGIGNVDLDPAGKDIVIQSENGPGSCFIDCGGNARGFVVQTDEGSDTVIRGFTIQHGYAVDFGGAIHMLNSSPVIENCMFQNNKASYGAAVSAINGEPTVSGCQFYNNNADEFGGAILLANSTATVSNCHLSWNFARSGAGIFCCWFAQPRLINNLIIWNSAETGGGISAEYMGFPEIFNCTIANNSGDGIACSWSNFSAKNSVIYGNTPKEFSCPDGEPDISYCCLTEEVEGRGNISVDPLFAVGPQADYYLGSTGTMEPNPCVNTGDSLAEEVCWTVGSDMYCLDEFTTRVDMTADSGVVDMGYHYVTSDECLRFGTKIIGPEEEPEVGDSAGLEVSVCNPGSIFHGDLALFVIMEEAGEFFFWPGWTESDWMTVDVSPGESSWVIYEPVVWTDPAPDWFGNSFYAALTDSLITEIVGEIGIYPYRFDL